MRSIPTDQCLLQLSKCISLILQRDILGADILTAGLNHRLLQAKKTTTPRHCQQDNICTYVELAWDRLALLLLYSYLRQVYPVGMSLHALRNACSTCGRNRKKLDSSSNGTS